MNLPQSSDPATSDPARVDWASDPASVDPASAPASAPAATPSARQAEDAAADPRTSASGFVDAQTAAQPSGEASQASAGMAAPSAAAVFSGCSNMRLRRLTRLVSRHYDAHLAQCGLKTTQYSLLVAVADRGPLQQGDLARQLSLDVSTLTRNLRLLVDAGLLTVEAGSDARSRQVSITAAGRERRVEASGPWKRAQHEFNDVVGIERAASLHDVVDTCYRMLVASDDRRTK